MKDSRGGSVPPMVFSVSARPPHERKLRHHHVTTRNDIATTSIDHVAMREDVLKVVGWWWCGVELNMVDPIEFNGSSRVAVVFIIITISQA